MFGVQSMLPRPQNEVMNEDGVWKKSKLGKSSLIFIGDGRECYFGISSFAYSNILNISFEEIPN